MYVKVLLVLSMAAWLLGISAAEAAAARPRIAKPGCKDHCGNVSIPYPFGIGPNCYHNPWFDVECPYDDSFNLKKLSVTGSQINWDPVKEERSMIAIVACNRICERDGNPRTLVFGNSYNLTGSPFLFSRKRNVILVNGCGGGIVLLDKNNQTIAGCAAVCVTNSTKQDVDCFGVGCCQTSISSSVDYYSLQVVSMGSNRIVGDACTRAVLVDTNWIANKSKNLEHYQVQNICDPAHVVMEWTVTDLPINSPSYANSSCTNKAASADDAGGYVCRCKGEFYEGNPYLPHGCQDVRGCEDCVQDCISLGNHNFGCPLKKEKVNTTTIAIGLGLGISIVLVLALLGVYWLYHVHKRRRNLRIKAKNFERNGGLLLKQQMSSEDNNVEKTRILTSDELEKATDQYNENRIVGQGGQGTVYKGMLSDGKLVAVKKSKILDESQMNVFINEEVILSKINHRNVVKLIGCCLETEVPMLVYEYVPNGTLSQNIHVNKEDYFPITWEMRLYIATDIANALAYLHSSYLIPIFHRDIKSSNILLDNKYRAKLSDFGISKSLSVDQTHITTRIVGTFGYLDPGYFQSNQFTDKSDVYSFGVVLVELLSGQKATGLIEDEERGLVAWFLEHMGYSLLYEILDARVIREGSEEDIMVVAHLAKRCLNLDGKRRPAMKEVVAELETVRSSLQHGLTRNQSTLSNEQDEATSSSIDMTLEDPIEEEHLFASFN